LIKSKSYKQPHHPTGIPPQTTPNHREDLIYV
jgi:hypothetical protein